MCVYSRSHKCCPECYDPFSDMEGDTGVLIARCCKQAMCHKCYDIHVLSPPTECAEVKSVGAHSFTAVRCCNPCVRARWLCAVVRYWDAVSTQTEALRGSAPTVA